MRQRLCSHPSHPHPTMSLSRMPEPSRSPKRARGLLPETPLQSLHQAIATLLSFQVLLTRVFQCCPFLLLVFPLSFKINYIELLQKLDQELSAFHRKRESQCGVVVKRVGGGSGSPGFKSPLVPWVLTGCPWASRSLSA